MKVLYNITLNNDCIYFNNTDQKSYVCELNCEKTATLLEYLLEEILDIFDCRY